MRSFLSTSFLILNSEFRWAGSWCHPPKILFICSFISTECQKCPLREVSIDIQKISYLSLSISLSPPARERPHTIKFCCHNLSADENDQNAYPACGTAITLLVDSFGRMIRINSLNYFYDRYYLLAPPLATSCLDPQPYKQVLQNTMDRLRTAALLLSALAGNVGDMLATRWRHVEMLPI
jgi:hypothetical protein